MIILHYTGTGYGFMEGVSEYIMLFEDEDDTIAEHATIEEAMKAYAAPGFELDRKYDTDIDTDFCTLPMKRSLVSHM